MTVFLTLSRPLWRQSSRALSRSAPLASLSPSGRTANTKAGHSPDRAFSTSLPTRGSSAGKSGDARTIGQDAAHSLRHTVRSAMNDFNTTSSDKSAITNMNLEEWLPDLEGKVALVTGSSSGVGFEIAMALALARARVLIVSKRDNVADNALATINGRLSIQRRELERESGSGSTDGGEDLNIEGLSGGQGNVEYLKADLADLADTLRVAKEIEQKTDKLDFFISDASVNAIKTVPDSTVDSVQLDAQITANVISTFLLTNRLLPLMRNAAKVQASEGGQASGPGPNTGTSLGVRFVNISSELHRLAPPNSTRFESLQEFSTSVPAAEQHARAKLANILFTRQLANNVLLPNGDRIRALAVHPGAPPSSDPSITANGSADAAEAGGAGVSNDSGPKGTVSSAASGPGPIKSALNALMKPFTRDASPAGAATPLWAATSNLVDEHNLQGAYLSSPDAGQAGKESDLAKDDRVAENLWQMCEYVVKSRVGQDALRDWNAK